jgi:hypothetical protein
VYADPKEVKRRRERERYANNKDDISKHRRHLHELFSSIYMQILKRKGGNGKGYIYYAQDREEY